MGNESSIKVAVRPAIGLMQKFKASSYAKLLRKYGAFRGKDSYTFPYLFDDAGFAALKARYGLDAVAGDGDDLTRALNILRWVSMHARHDGSNLTPQRSAGELFEYLENHPDKGINCHKAQLC